MRIKNLAYISISVFALIACSEGAKKGEDVAKGKAAISKTSTGAVNGGLDVLPAGDYAISMQVTKMDIPGLTPEEVADVKGEIANPVAHETCLTEDDLKPEGDVNTMEAVISVILGDTQGSGCTFTDFSTKGGNISGQMSCPNSSLGNISSGKISGNIAADKTEFAVDGIITAPDISDKPITMALITHFKRKGDCKG